jgi:hypothetical protein
MRFLLEKSQLEIFFDHLNNLINFCLAELPILEKTTFPALLRMITAELSGARPHALRLELDLMHCESLPSCRV